MPRNISAAEETEARAETTRWVYLVEMDFSSGMVRATNAPFSIFHQGNEFHGVGDFGGISAVEETTEGRANRITLTLTGVKQSQVSIALNDQWRWRRCTVWKAFLDSGHAVVDTPKIRFQGWMDQMPVSLGKDGEPATISLTVASRTAKWERAFDNPRYSDADHQLRRPGDKFFQFMPEIAAGKEVFWGKT